MQAELPFSVSLRTLLSIEEWTEREAFVQREQHGDAHTTSELS